MKPLWVTLMFPQHNHPTIIIKVAKDIEITKLTIVDPSTPIVKDHTDRTNIGWLDVTCQQFSVTTVKNMDITCVIVLH